MSRRGSDLLPDPRHDRLRSRKSEGLPLYQLELVFHVWQLRHKRSRTTLYFPAETKQDAEDHAGKLLARDEWTLERQ